MRLRRVILRIGGSFALLGGLIFGFYYFILDWEGRPYCHKQIMFAFFHWMDHEGMPIHSDTNAFPNINGESAASLAPISKLIGPPMDLAGRYNYVPGLREDDPGELVLMYIDRLQTAILQGETFQHGTDLEMASKFHPSIKPFVEETLRMVLREDGSH